MHFDLLEAALFVAAAVALLGSPGPGIAALVAVGRSRGVAGGLAFYGGLQAGLALAAAATAAGLFSAIQRFPAALAAMGALAVAYLVYLAFRIATAPAPAPVEDGKGGSALTLLGGFVLGIANPKAYAVFLSLMAAYSIVGQSAPADAAVKWALCVLVMAVVDLAWLWAGAMLGKAKLPPAGERAVNIVMALTIVLAAIFAFR